MWELIPLALLSAVYPTLVAVAVAALTARRPARVMAFFLLGGMIASVGVGLVIVFALQGTSVVSGSNSPVNPAVYFGAGAFALAFAFVLERRPPAKHKDKNKDGRVTRLLSRSENARIAFTAGFVLDLAPGAWYLVALKDIAQSSYTATEVVAIVVAFCIIQYALIELPLLGFVVAPERAARFSRRFSAWLGENSRKVAEMILVVGGCYLIARGIISVL